MPVYAFSCGACGEFELWRRVGDAGAAAACPSCGTEGRRRFTPPGVARTAAPLRVAREREQRSAHEPALATSPSGGALPWAGGHEPHPPWTVGH